MMDKSSECKQTRMIGWLYIEKSDHWFHQHSPRLKSADWEKKGLSTRDMEKT